VSNGAGGLLPEGAFQPAVAVPNPCPVDLVYVAEGCPREGWGQPCEDDIGARAPRLRPALVSARGAPDRPGGAHPGPDRGRCDPRRRARPHVLRVLFLRGQVVQGALVLDHVAPRLLEECRELGVARRMWCPRLGKPFLHASRDREGLGERQLATGHLVHGPADEEVLTGPDASELEIHGPAKGPLPIRADGLEPRSRRRAGERIHHRAGGRHPGPARSRVAGRAVDLERHVDAVAGGELMARRRREGPALPVGLARTRHDRRRDAEGAGRRHDHARRRAAGPARGRVAHGQPQPVDSGGKQEFLLQVDPVARGGRQRHPLQRPLADAFSSRQGLVRHVEAGVPPRSLWRERQGSAVHLGRNEAADHAGRPRRIFERVGGEPHGDVAAVHG
jgi:hypothetical protein